VRHPCNAPPLSARQNCSWIDLARKPRLCLTKYLAMFVGKYLQTHPHLRTHLRQQLRRSLYLDLNLNLNLQLYPSLYRALLAKLFGTLFEKTFASLFGSLFQSKFQPLQASTCLALYRQGLRGRRPGGRPPHDRIVVENGLTTTYR
jgi:hypothetical protein